MNRPHETEGSSRAWQRDHPWAWVYDQISGSSRLGALLWRLGVGSAIDVLHQMARTELDRLPSGATVLDIPCGGGIALRDLAVDHRLRYVAADISTTMLERTRREARRLGLDGIETVEMDVGDLPLADGQVDLVMSFASLHCFPDPRAAVSEYGRVLAPGGSLALSALTTDCAVRFRPIWPLGRAAGVLGPGCSRPELVAWLEEAGFTGVDLRPAGALTYVTATRDR